MKDEDKIKKAMDEMEVYGDTIGIKAVNTVEVPRERERKNKEYFILWEIHTYRSPSSTLQV